MWTNGEEQRAYNTKAFISIMQQFPLQSTVFVRANYVAWLYRPDSSNDIE